MEKDNQAHNSTQITQQEEQESEKTLLILLFSEFQPIHNGHLKMMDLAKQFLESQFKNLNVKIQGQLVPYNKNQLHFQYLDDDFRLRMLSIAIKQSNWISLNDSLIEKKVKNQKDLIEQCTKKQGKSKTLEVFQVMSIDKYKQIQKQIDNYSDQNIIFIDYRFTFEDDKLENIKQEIQSQSKFHFIKDNSFDSDIHSSVIRDVYEGGYDISLYVCPDILKFHKSQNVKYKKALTLTKENQKLSKTQQKLKEMKVKQSDKKDKQEKGQKLTSKPQVKKINLKDFIDFDFTFIDSKNLSGFNDMHKPQSAEREDKKIKDGNQNENEEDISEESKQQTAEKNKDYLGSGLQARVQSMKYFIEEKDQEIEVAVKMVKFNNQVSRRQATFYRDLRGVQRCNGHPNVVQVLGAGNIMDIGYIVLERCTKVKFKNWISKYSGLQLLSNYNFMQLITDLSSGCEHMSKMGILHRDLQINNILIKLKGEDQNLENFEIEDVVQLKLSDFGVSAIEEDKQNIVKGSTRHYSPETIEDKVNYTDKADVFSFGALIYEIFYKYWVFPDCTVQESSLKTKSGEFSPFDDIIPSRIKEIIMLTWKFDPKERISFSNLTQLLQQYTNTLKISNN